MNTRTMKRSESPGSGRLLNRTEKLELRAQAVEQIKVLLAEKPRSPLEIAERLGLHKSTAYAHLNHMASELRLVRRSGHFDAKRRELWILGADHSLPTVEDRLDGFKMKVATVPARQLGMARDALVAALFGTPGQGASAC